MRFYCIAPCNEKNRLTVDVSFEDPNAGDEAKFIEEMQDKVQDIVYHISDLDLEKENDCMIIGRVQQQVKYDIDDIGKNLYIVECANTRERLKQKRIYVHVDLSNLTPQQKELVIDKKCLTVFYGKLGLNKRKIYRNSLINVNDCSILEGVSELNFGIWDSELFFRTASNRVILEGEVSKITTSDEGDECIKRFIFQYKNGKEICKVNCFMKTPNREDLDAIQAGARLTLIGSLLVYQDRIKESLYYIYQIRVFAIAV